MANSMPHLPPEIMLMAISSPNIDLASLLRCTRVNKEWHSLIHDSNTLRAKLFLPPRSASGKLLGAINTPYSGNIIVTNIVDTKPEDRHPSTETMALSSLQDVTIHPLLLRHRVKDHYENDVLSLSYRILEHLFHFNKKTATSWHTMCITNPPMHSLCLHVDCYRCDNTSGDSMGTKQLYSPTGITIKDLFDAIWDTDLTWILGLVPDDGSCQGRDWQDTDGQGCRCYDIVGARDRAKARLEKGEESLRRAQEREMTLENLVAVQEELRQLLEESEE